MAGAAASGRLLFGVGLIVLASVLQPCRSSFGKSHVLHLQITQ